MALETGTFIDSLNANNPAITDQIDQGDDHIRLIKSTIKSTFPSITGAVTLTHTQINALETRLGTAETNITSLNAGVTGNDADLATLDAGKANIAGDTFTGNVIIQGSTTLATATATTPTDLTDSSTNIATTSFVQQKIAALDPLPAGMIAPFAGTSTPTGWLICDGSAVNRVTYASLFAALGTTYGAGNGSTTFNLPDLRGRVPAGRDNMGTNGDADNITTAGAGIDGNSLGATGGAQTVTLTHQQSGLPAHGHNDSFGVRRVSGTDDPQPHAGYIKGTGANISTDTGGIGGSVTDASAADASQAHNNVQPTIILNYIVKT